MSTLRAILFLIIMPVFLLALGDIIGHHEGVYVAAIVAILAELIAIFSSDRVLLNLFKAKQILADTHPDIHATMQAVAVKAGLSLPKIYLIKTNAINLFAVGRTQKNAAIAITEGLMASLSEEEKTAVIAQGIAQIKLGNSFLSQMIGTISGGISGIANSHWDEILLNETHPKEKPHFNETVMRFLGPIAALIPKIFISPTMHFDADTLSVKWTENKAALVSALKKMNSEKDTTSFLIAQARPATSLLFVINPVRNSKWENMFNTHPHLNERIKLLS